MAHDEDPQLASLELHRRVREFARGQSTEPFDELALSIARFQARHSPGYGRLVSAKGAGFGLLEDAPAVPADVFRILRVSVFAEGDDVAVFRTSGTTQAESGSHYFRSLDTYDELALRAGSWALRRSDDQLCTPVALAPLPKTPNHSSLTHMMELFMTGFDGRAFGTGEFNARVAERWLTSEEGVDVPGLYRAAEVAGERGEPLLVLSTSFALVHLLDALKGARVELPRDSVVMQTGGFKGRSRIVNELDLRHDVALAFGLEEERVVGEYGMTELSSQFYEGTRPGASWWGPRGQYIEPPWARIDAVDPETLELLPVGEVGIARITDLGNVDSAVIVQTQDRVRRGDAGIELFGRTPGAPARGCSLATEILLGGKSPAGWDTH